ncbi:ABC transporter permease [Paenibacillus sinopodophylli]|uniref:ABC transporter permease n=1 Tax=Paenibacillus sinopodophylli TaxID=1837342 RepID=UPI001FE6E7F8|nr:ABC transporter permease subunit [Paenibacillus sinopodophylli]
MLNFGGLVQNEWLKMSKKRSFMIAFAVMLIAIVGITFLIWKLSVVESPDLVIEEQFKSVLDFTASMMSATGLGMVITIISIIFTAGIVAKEHQLGTIKFLLIRAHGRNKILASKYVAALLFVSSIIVFSLVVSFISGGFAFGFDTSTGQETWSGVAESVWYQSVYTFIYVTLTFMVSILTRSSGATIGIGMAAVLIEGPLQMLLSRYDFSKYLLFMNTNLSQFSESGSNGGIAFPSLVCAAYAALFLIIGFVAFKKRDI